MNNAMFISLKNGLGAAEHVKSEWEKITARKDITGEDKANFKSHAVDQALKKINERKAEIWSNANAAADEASSNLRRARAVDESELFKRAQVVMPLLAGAGDEQLINMYKNQYHDSIARKLIEEAVSVKVMSSPNPESCPLYSKFIKLENSLQKHLPEKEQEAIREDKKAKLRLEYADKSDYLLDLEAVELDRQLKGGSLTTEEKVVSERLKAELADIEEQIRS